jgi:hypothetical protein
MPDRFGFTHEPHRGIVFNRCIECDEYPWGRTIREDERRRHFEQHQRDRSFASDRRRREALAAAQQTQRLLAREAAYIEERYGAPQPSSKKGAKMAEEATDGQLAAELRTALEGLPSKLIEKKAYHRIDQDGLTLGYAYLGARQPSVEVPTGHGVYERQSVTSKSDIRVVLNKLQAVVDRAAAKKAGKAEATAKPAAEDKPAAKARSAAKGKTDEVTPDPKPSRRSRAKAASA